MTERKLQKRRQIYADPTVAEKLCRNAKQLKWKRKDLAYEIGISYKLAHRVYHRSHVPLHVAQKCVLIMAAAFAVGEAR